MDYVELVLFAIQAAIRLGQKLQTVFEEETRDNPLVLPPVEGTQLPTFDEAEPFFASEEGRSFVAFSTATNAAGQPLALGMYADLWRRRNDPATGGAARDELVQAFARIRALQASDSREIRGSLRGDDKNFLAKANALFVVKQWREGDDPKRHPVQRIAGTIIDIALDYVKIDPRLFGGEGRGDRLTRAFLLSLDKVDFAESTFDDLAVDVFDASLRTVSENGDLVLPDEHWSLLLRKVSLTLAQDFAKASGNDDKLAALYRFRRELLQDVIKTAASVVGGSTDRFLGTPAGGGDALLQAVLKGVLASLQEAPNLFTGRAAADVFAAAMKAVAENARLVLPDGAANASGEFLAELLTAVGKQLSSSAAATPPGLLTADLLAETASIALQVTAANAARLIAPSDPRRQPLADALQCVTSGLALALQQNSSLSQAVPAVVSRSHLLDIVRLALTAVAEHHAALLGPTTGDPRHSALAQIVAAVAHAIGADPSHLLNGDDCVELVRIALQAVARNPDRLLQVETADPRRQVLGQVITSVLSAASRNLQAGGRDLLTGGTLLQIAAAALAAVSSDVDGFRREPDIVSMVLDRLLHAASSALRNQLDANAVLQVFTPVLVRGLQGRAALDVSDADLILPILTAAA